MSLASVTQEEICEQIERLPLSARVHVVQFVLQSLASESFQDTSLAYPLSRPREREFGFLKTKIEMSDDFDEPLDCMAEYM
ncbi:MAG: DUF2281 domain-containing protein [Thermoguttaceae bacterium]